MTDYGLVDLKLLLTWWERLSQGSLLRISTAQYNHRSAEVPLGQGEGCVDRRHSSCCQELSKGVYSVDTLRAHRDIQNSKASNIKCWHNINQSP